MLVRKLAGVFALMAVGSFLVAWVLCRFWVDGAMTMEPERALAWAIYVAAIFYFVGLFLSTLGLGLLQEVLAERRSRELERRFRARVEYERVMAGDGGVSAPATETPSGAG